MAYFEERIDEDLVNGLVGNLMAADNKRVAAMLNALIDDNDTKLNGYTTMCFRHGEVMYYHEEYRRGGFSNTYMTPILHKDLRDRFEVIERERLILKEHTQKIKQILTILLKGVRDRQMLRATVLLKGVRDHQMLRDLLPDCMSQYVIPHKERRMPQHLVWQLTDRQIREYQEILPLIQMYSASNILL